MEFFLHNIKCSSCSTLIENKMNSIIGISSSHVDVDKGLLSLEGPSINRTLVLNELKELGFPEVENTSSFPKEKSFKNLFGIIKD